MLILPSKPSDEYLLRIAECLLHRDIISFQAIVELIHKVGDARSTWELRLRIANILVVKGQREYAKALLAHVDLSEYSHRLENSVQLKQLLNMLIVLNRTDEALAIFHKQKLTIRLTFSDELDIRIKIAEALMSGQQVDVAKQLLNGIDVVKAYAENFSLKDGFAKIGWVIYWPQKKFEKVVEYCNIDLEIDRLSSRWCVNMAKATSMTKGMSSAMPLLDKAYTKNVSLKSAYSQVAWICHITNNLAYEKVIPYFEKDVQLSRVDTKWQLNYAQALVMIGNEEEAKRQIRNAYRSDASLANGYARCAYLRFIFCDEEPEKSLCWYEYDQKLAKLKGMFQVYRACMYGASGDIQVATSIVEKAYDEDLQIINGYALVGFYYAAQKMRILASAIKYFEKDKEKKRLKGYAVHYYAGLFAAVGQRERAEAIIRQNYECDLSLEGGNLYIGLCDYVRSKDIDYLYKMVSMDDSMGRISTIYYSVVYASILLKYGEVVKAEQIVKQSVVRSSLSYGFSKSWFKRIVIGGCDVLEEFFTPELEKMFSTACKSNNFRYQNSTW